MNDIVKRLRKACIGHPFARIPWPHYVLHEAADEIERLRKALEDERDMHRCMASLVSEFHADVVMLRRSAADIEAGRVRDVSEVIDDMMPRTWEGTTPTVMA